MKGIIIYENDLGAINAAKLKHASFCCEITADDITDTLKGTPVICKSATCNKEDTYDFETGALIALMKMCGVEKVKKAAKETFFDVEENSVNEYEEEIKKLRDEIIDLDYRKTCNETTIELLYNTINTLSGIDDKYKELKEENEKLKLDCEKLQHGYIDTDMIFCGGRQNGKQYTLLVDLFKRIPQNKVDEAYKEAYNTKLPVWQREFLKEALSIYKPPTKREQMWNDILACGDCKHSKYVEVKKEDLEMFAKECNEKKIFSIIGYEFHLQEFWFADDRCIFQIFRKPAGFICAKSVSFAPENAIIDYLPPMRWDLFKKGRRIIRVTPDKLDEFMTKCSKELGAIMKPNLKRYKDFTHAFIMISDYHYDNKPTIHIMTPEDLVRNQHENPKKYSDKKIVDWEDLR